MAAPSVFFDNHIAVGVETTYGTPVAATVAFKVVDGTFNAQVNDALVPSAAGGGVGTSALFGYNATIPRAFLPNSSYELSFEVEAEADDIGFWFASMMGAPTYQVDTPVASAYTHNFKALVTSASAQAKPLTLFWNDTLQDYRFTSFKVETIRIISGTGGAPIRLAISGPAQTVSATSTSFATLSTAPWLEWPNAAIRRDAVATKPDSSDDLGSGEEVSSFEIVTTCPLRRRYAVGSRLLREPVWNGRWSSMLTAPKDFFSTTFQAIMRNATVTSRASYWTVFMNTAINITGSTKYSLEWDCPVGYLQGDFPTFPGEDVNAETLSVVAAYDGTNPHFQFNLVNGTSDAAAYTA